MGGVGRGGVGGGVGGGGVGGGGGGGWRVGALKPPELSSSVSRTTRTFIHTRAFPIVGGANFLKKTPQNQDLRQGRQP